MAKFTPVVDWATDFDHAHPEYGARAPEILEDLRARCPVAHSERYGGVWVPTRAEDIRAVVMDTDHFSNRASFVSNQRPAGDAGRFGATPPISTDPPHHTAARQMLLPQFAPKVVQETWEPRTRAYCQELLDGIERRLDAGETVVDAAVDYAQHIPARITAQMLGLPEDGELFRSSIYRMIEDPGGDDFLAVAMELAMYMGQRIAERQEQPEADDLIRFLLDARDEEGNPLALEHVLGTSMLMFLAGVDTTWSAIGASLWHLAQHDADRRRWIEDPGVRPLAVEEFLRFYSPVFIARLANEGASIAGCPVQPDEWVLAMYPAYNRDPAIFERADKFIIDRAANRHAAFGLGIHRCLGSNLARMEMAVAIEEWVDRFNDFELADPAAVRWSSGQARGPRTIPVRINR
jgi:cytochrome P450